MIGQLIITKTDISLKTSTRIYQLCNGSIQAIGHITSNRLAKYNVLSNGNVAILKLI